MRMSEAELLILPDYQGLTPDDWQNRWIQRMKTANLVDQESWTQPDRDIWVQTLRDSVAKAKLPVILVGHGLGIATIVHGAPELPVSVVGAILVAPRLIDNAPEFASFAPLPTDPLPFPSMLIAAHNDELCPIEQAAEMANAWGSEFHEAGNSGHINAASGQGIWPEGMMILSRLLKRL